MTLSEAQGDCDMFFSNAIMDGSDGVYLLHGHGTGVLKAGIRRVRTHWFFVLRREGCVLIFFAWLLSTCQLTTAYILRHGAPTVLFS